jgi:hypothetical protein
VRFWERIIMFTNWIKVDSKVVINKYTFPDYPTVLLPADILYPMYRNIYRSSRNNLKLYNTKYILKQGLDLILNNL